MLQIALKPIATLAATSSTADSSLATGGADTYNWDTVFALTYKNVNAAIAANWTDIEANPPTVQDDVWGDGSDVTTYTLDITFGAWQITLDGDGKNINFGCPVKSGNYTVTRTTQNDDPSQPPTVTTRTYPFEPSNNGSTITYPTITIQVEMVWIPDPLEPYIGLSSPDVPTIRTALASGTIPGELINDLQSHQPNPITLSNSATVAPINSSKPSLAWIITDGAKSYYLFYRTDKEDNQYILTYQFGENWQGNLKTQSEEINSSTPPVTILGIDNNPVPSTAKSNAAMLTSLLQTWFNDNLDVFNHVFATLNISNELDQNDKWSWLKPTGTSYAVVDEGTSDQSIFGVLTMTGGAQALPNHQISPNAIPADGSGPNGTGADASDAGFLISGPLFMEKIMLAGAMAIFDTTDPKVFEHPTDANGNVNDALLWRNVADLVWGPFITSDTATANVGSTRGNDIDTVTTNLDNNSTAGTAQVNFSTTFTPYLSDVLKIPKDSPLTVKTKGSEWVVVDSSNVNNQFALKLEDVVGDPGNQTVNIYSATQLHIPAKQFSMSLNNSQIDVAFVNLNYAYSPDFNVSINYNESWNLGLKEVKGRKIFWFTEVFNKGLVISVQKTQSAINRDIVEGAIAGIMALVAIAGPVIEGLSAGAEVGEVTEEGGEAVIDAKTFEEVENSNPDAAKADEAEAGGEAANQSGGKWSNIKAAFKTPKWKAFGTITALVGAAAAGDTLAQDIIEAVATNEWENVPSFDGFANLCIEPYTFPNVKGFTLNSATLNESLQIGLKLNS